jgi:hypothetical protein
MTTGGDIENPTFSFEHAMSHRTLLGTMSPLTRFSVLPYFLDPMQYTDIVAGNWHIIHWQAQSDAFSYLPSYYNAYNYIRTITHPQPPPPQPPIPPTSVPPTLGLPNGQVMSDADFSTDEGLKWWEFTNMIEHQVAEGTILPVSAPNTRWLFPFV